MLNIKWIYHYKVQLALHSYIKRYKLEKILIIYKYMIHLVKKDLILLFRNIIKERIFALLFLI